MIFMATGSSFHMTDHPLLFAAAIKEAFEECRPDNFWTALVERMLSTIKSSFIRETIFYQSNTSEKVLVSKRLDILDKLAFPMSFETSFSPTSFPTVKETAASIFDLQKQTWCQIVALFKTNKSSYLTIFFLRCVHMDVK